MKLMSRNQWKYFWTEFEAKGKTMPLMEYSRWIDGRKAAISKEWPGHDWSNGRYAVQVEKFLEAGEDVSTSELTPADIRYDWQAFPNLAPLLGYTMPARKEAA